MVIKINSLSKLINEEGILVFFSKVFRYIRKNILGVNKAIIYEFDLNNHVPEIKSELNVTFRLATKNDIDLMDYKNYNYDDKAKKYLKERLKKGDNCVLALYNDKIVAYVWINYEYLDLSEFNLIPLSKKRVSGYNFFTLKEFRGKRVNNSMDGYISDNIKKAGKRFIVVIIDKDNKASIKTRERANFKKIGYVNQIRFFGLKYDYISKKLLSYLQN